MRRLQSRRPYGFDDGRAEAQVGNEMAIHHVDMNIIGARRIDGGNLLAEAREIGGQYGWGYFHLASLIYS